MPKLILTKPPEQCNQPILKSLLATATHLVFQYSPAHECINTDIRVSYGPKGPHIRFEGTCAQGFDIDLTAGGDLWHDHILQFVQEVTHILAMYQRVQHANQWFEEAVCDAATQYVLRLIANIGAEGHRTWANLKMGPPPTPLYESLRKRADQIFHDKTRQCSDQSLRTWFHKNEAILTKAPYDRSLNGVVANRLLLMFLETPSNWAAVEFLNAKPCEKNHDSFSEYLANWRATTQSQYHPLIDRIRYMLLET
jgi:hypothetical protein